MFACQYVIGTGFAVQREISAELADELAGLVQISETPFEGVRVWSDEDFARDTRERVQLLIGQMTDYEKSEFSAFIQSFPNMGHT